MRKEFQYYLDNQKELVKKYNGKFIVIVGEAVFGAFDTRAEAIQEAIKEHKLGTFLVQQVEKGKDSYTQTFHTRVAFYARQEE